MTLEEALRRSPIIYDMQEREEVESFIKQIYDDFKAKDKFRKCNNCKHKDGESGGRLIHCSYFEQFMPTEIGKCDIWEDKSAR